MNRLSLEPEHLRHLASVLRREVVMIDRHNRSLKRAETESGHYFPAEKSVNASRIESLNQAAAVLEALAEKKIVVAEN